MSSAEPSRSGHSTRETDTGGAAAEQQASNTDTGYTRFEVIEAETVRDALAFPSSEDARLGKWVWYAVGLVLLVVLGVGFGDGAAVGAGGMFVVGMAAGICANERVVHAVLDAAEVGVNDSE